MTKKIREINCSDLFGVYYVKKFDRNGWNSYFETINSLRSLFKKDRFSELVNGFYLNVTGNFDSVRISYFVDKLKIKDASQIFKEYFKNSGLAENKAEEYPREIVLAKNYGGAEWEWQFRNFLIIETQIGLDLLDKDILNSRILFAAYIFQTRNVGSPSRQHFEPTFEKYSSSYNCLSDEDKDNFFDNFNKWNHFMVNFVLGADCRNIERRSLPISEINEGVKQLGFQIPLDWRPLQDYQQEN